MHVAIAVFLEVAFALFNVLQGALTFSDLHASAARMRACVPGRPFTPNRASRVRHSHIVNRHVTSPAVSALAFDSNKKTSSFFWRDFCNVHLQSVQSFGHIVDCLHRVNIFLAKENASSSACVTSSVNQTIFNSLSSFSTRFFFASFVLDGVVIWLIKFWTVFSIRQRTL
jgi:hypothetical protein